MENLFTLRIHSLTSVVRSQIESDAVMFEESIPLSFYTGLKVSHEFELLAIATVKCSYFVAELDIASLPGVDTVKSIRVTKPQNYFSSKLILTIVDVASNTRKFDITLSDIPQTFRHASYGFCIRTVSEYEGIDPYTQVSFFHKSGSFMIEVKKIR
jgi:hypothetical protein